MGVMLEKSRVAEDMLEVIGHLSGSLREGMAVALIAVGVLMGASTGCVGNFVFRAIEMLKKETSHGTTQTACYPRRRS
jgi:TRAP-type mannitol/chloroaromatic compound transport system permease large subunit